MSEALPGCVSGGSLADWRQHRREFNRLMEQRDRAASEIAASVQRAAEGAHRLTERLRARGRDG